MRFCANERRRIIDIRRDYLMQNNQQTPYGYGPPPQGYQPPPKRKTWAIVLSIVLIVFGSIFCFVGAVFLAIVVIMPDSIVAYYVMDFLEALRAPSPFLPLIIGIVLIAFGIVLLRIRVR
jgi:hypothetical protein